MVYILQLAIYCIIFTLTVLITLRGNAVNILYFYPKEIQERVFEIGLIDEKTINKKKSIFIPILFIVMTFSLIFIIGNWNRVVNFKGAFIEALFFLELWNIYDGIIMDKMWPEKSKVLLIPGTEDMKYIPTWAELIKKRLVFVPILAVGALIVAKFIDIVY